ncbi:hypothetical protein NEHOM01_0388 [Nematocida homosporus]|uniref:uncharacterized protein n=1 Tax=Nematocida homosporus TaxID=1912981 RepID=UPI00222111C0|nr:uncharacterized protein NEHOM01_0388 [Nematocida homosporus]KAI5184786.1 hypothetical protein NEHOM01_0388 [Nematocida homosporus]
MKIELESAAVIEKIFSELSEDSNTPEEEQVLSAVKNLFLKNIRVGSSANTAVAAAESTRIERLQALCAVRRNLPEQLRVEVTKSCEELLDQARQEIAVVASTNQVEGLESKMEASKEVNEVGRRMQELAKAFPEVLGQMREYIASAELEVKESNPRNAEVEPESLALLFKDELDLASLNKE